MSFACCDKLCLWLCCVKQSVIKGNIKQSVIKGNIKKKKTKQPKKTIFITDLGNDLRRQAYEVCDSGKRKKLMFFLYDRVKIQQIFCFHLKLCCTNGG